MKLQNLKFCENFHQASKHHHGHQNNNHHHKYVTNCYLFFCRTSSMGLKKETACLLDARYINLLILIIIFAIIIIITNKAILFIIIITIVIIINLFRSHTTASPDSSFWEAPPKSARPMVLGLR